MPEGDVPAETPPPPLVPAPAAPQEEPSEEPPWGEIIPREPRRDSWWGGRMALELLGGSLLGFVGFVPGAYVMINGDIHGNETQFGVGLSLTGIGLTAGATFGVVGAASLLGGEGRFLPTLAGSGLGLVGGMLAALALGPQIGEAAFLALIMGPPIGALIGYEYSHAKALESGPAPTASAPRVMPLVTVTPRGGILGGLVGRF
jgi:hypothetical protein